MCPSNEEPLISVAPRTNNMGDLVKHSNTDERSSRSRHGWGSLAPRTSGAASRCAKERNGGGGTFLTIILAPHLMGPPYWDSRKTRLSPNRPRVWTSCAPLWKANSWGVGENVAMISRDAPEWQSRDIDDTSTYRHPMFRARPLVGNKIGRCAKRRRAIYHKEEVMSPSAQ